MPFFIDYRLYPYPLLFFTYRTGYDVYNSVIRWYPASIEYSAYIGDGFCEKCTVVREVGSYSQLYLGVITKSILCSSPRVRGHAGSILQYSLHTKYAD